MYRVTRSETRSVKILPATYKALTVVELKYVARNEEVAYRGMP
jgi:hypothetical protein